MKIVRISLLLLLSLFLTIGLFYGAGIIFPAVKQGKRNVHQVQVMYGETTEVADVDLFDRADDSENHTMVLYPLVGIGISLQTLFALLYILIALYVSEIFIPLNKILFDCIWQKTVTSL